MSVLYFSFDLYSSLLAEEGGAMVYASLGSGSGVVQRTATHCNTLQHTATHYNTLQHTATHYNTHCNTLQHAATLCNTLQHTVLAEEEEAMANASVYCGPSLVVRKYV